jgi:hypothetical protein
MKKGFTKDEIFLLKLYDMAAAQGDPQTEIDRYAAGRAVGYNDRSVDSLVRLLLQANFVKKGDGTALYFTDHGLRLIHHLKQP